MRMNDLATLPLPLTSQEHSTLHILEERITRGLVTFYEVGEALILIRNGKLYREKYRTFEAYCLERWKIGRASAYRMIDAAEVKEAVSPNGDAALPENETQVRALKAAPTEKQAYIWAKAQATAPNGKVTAKHIDQVIRTEIPMPAPEPDRQVSLFVGDVVPTVKGNSQAERQEIEATRREEQVKPQIEQATPAQPYGFVCDVCHQRITKGGMSSPDGEHICLPCAVTRKEAAAPARGPDDDAEIALEHLTLSIGKMSDAAIYHIIKLAKRELTRRHRPKQEGGQAASRKYRWTDGRVLEVKAGLGGDNYMTMWQKPNKLAWKRFIRTELPVRNTRQEAQDDLDAFAQAHKLEQTVEAIKPQTDEDAEEETNDADTD